MKIQRETLLQQLFVQVWIPQAVSDELAQFHPVVPDFVHIHAVVDQTRVEGLLHEIDRGEAEAIVLAHEVGATYLLIDERRGRAKAVQLSVAVIGLLGVLILAKRQQLIPSVKIVIDELRDRADAYFSEKLVREVLLAAGEND